MKIAATNLPDIFVLEPAVHGDERGFFFESFNQKRFEEAIGRKTQFVQDNHSRSVKGVLRGLHYQIKQPQGKLIRALQGEIFDVAVDLRRHSATFGKWSGTVLSAENKKQMWVPEGFAHGFVVTERDGGNSLQGHRLLRAAARAFAALERPSGCDSLAAGWSADSVRQRPGRGSACAGGGFRVRLLVTGANGQVGWELRQSLAPLGEVIALDRAACDLARPAEAARILRAATPDIIVNAAAYTAVDRAEQEEELATLINGTAVGEIAETARQLGALLIHYSTDYVFDGRKDAPYAEDDVPHPISAYGRSKLAGERAIAQCGGRYLIVRTSWIYAARGHNFLKTVLRLARERDELRIVDDQIGAPTWARDLAAATAVMTRQARQEIARDDFESGLFHVTGSGATSWFVFAQAVVKQAEQSGLLARKSKIVPIASSEYPVAATRPKNSRLSGARARNRFMIALPEWEQSLALCMRELSA